MNRPDISETGAKAAAARQRAGLGQAMILGTNLAVGMVLFAFLGYVVDRRRGGGIFWTLCGMSIGLVYGTYEVWKVVRLLDTEIKQSPRNADTLIDTYTLRRNRARQWNITMELTEIVAGAEALK